MAPNSSCTNFELQEFFNSPKEVHLKVLLHLVQKKYTTHIHCGNKHHCPRVHQSDIEADNPNPHWQVHKQHVPVKNIWNMDSCQDLNRSWRISTTPNTTKIFLIIFKLIQQSFMVILSCLTEKKFEFEEKSSVFY